MTQYSSVSAMVRVNGVNTEIELTCSNTGYTGADGAAGCSGTKYDYDVIVAAPTFPAIFNEITYTEAQHQAYWNWVYTGYNRGGYSDWSENCHGFAFGVGAWPVNSSNLIEIGNLHCWIQDFSNATIADNTVHTVKIRVEDCPLSVGLQILETYEKFQESGIYTLTGACTLPIDMGLGNEPRGGMSFSYYKKQ